MNLCSTRGLVLNISSYGEADKLVTLYTRESGRMSAMAKGAWKSQKRFVNKLEIFSCLHIFYRPAQNASSLALLNEAELLAAHLRLRQYYSSYVTASYLCELVLRFTREHDPDPQIYDLLRWSFYSLDQGMQTFKVALFFHVHFLELIGYRPELNHCANCQTPVHSELDFTFFPARGSLLCGRCLKNAIRPQDSRLSLQTLKLLIHAQNSSPERIHRLRISEQATEEALTALYLYSVYLLQQDLHSWQTMQSSHAFNPSKRSSPPNQIKNPS